MKEKEYRSRDDYLEAVLMITEETGGCRSIDVAKKLGFSKPSVSNAMAKMEEEGLLKKEADGQLRLTAEGKRRAENTLAKHRFFAELLKKLGVGEQVAEEDACAMEHSLSDESYEALSRFVKEKTQ